MQGLRQPVPLPSRTPPAHTPATVAPPFLQAAERQGGELVDAQRHAQLLEGELEGKARESAALLADTLELKVGPGAAHCGNSCGRWGWAVR